MSESEVAFSILLDIRREITETNNLLNKLINLIREASKA